ncbi:MAG: T9SS type A sorting domain-containing protein [Bacteroidia bacterium]|nr:T9SS type A sorting domain-containing protein [Bacteroidia bacterium]
MKKIFRIQFFLLLLALAVRQGTSLQAQNLVLNPSFEDTISLDNSIHYQICKNWFNPNGATPDYFSPYAVQLGWGWVYNAPQTYYGFQQAENGVAFIALDIYEPNTSLTKEYAQGFLSQPLEQGKKYYVAMYINLVDSSNYKSCEIEIAFTDSLIYSNLAGSFNFTDTVKFNISNADTATWLFVTGKYTAHGGEKYIYIGSNVLNANITCVDTLPTGHYSTQAAYYFIDNIYVSENPLIVNIATSNQINVFPNPVSNKLYVNNLSKHCYYSIINITGLIIKKGGLYKNNNEINVSTIPNGIYFLIINEKEFCKIIINH